MTTYHVDGVAVHHYQPSDPRGGPPVVMVHGGCHAGWAWERYGPFFADRGWDCHAIDWYHHGQSAPLPTAEFIGRGITDVRREISAVAATLPTCHLMGHSMGALAALAAATSLRPRSLTMLTPVVPSQVPAEPIEVPVVVTEPFPVPPFVVAKALFFSTMCDAEASGYHRRLQPESSRAVWEATRWTVPVDLGAVRSPTLVVGAAEDVLTPARYARELASMLGDAEYREYPEVGHTDVLLKSTGWQRVATDVEAWLSAL